MSKELIVATGRHETRVAILEDDQLVEVFHEREKEYSLAGSIHKGRVTRVLPGMQSAFVNIGLERDLSCTCPISLRTTLNTTPLSAPLKRGSEAGEGAERQLRLSERRPYINSGCGCRRSTAKCRQSSARRSQPAREGRPAEARGDGRPAEARGDQTRGDQTRGDQNRGDQNRDRGGRGRRGRRRGGRGPGGIPESKYFTPGGERQGGDRHSAPVESRAVEHQEEPTSVEEAAHHHDGSPRVERFVLPGESLAKLHRTGTRNRGEAVAIQPVDARILPGMTWSAPASETAVEARRLRL